MEIRERSKGRKRRNEWTTKYSPAVAWQTPRVEDDEVQDVLPLEASCPLKSLGDKILDERATDWYWSNDKVIDTVRRERDRAFMTISSVSFARRCGFAFKECGNRTLGEGSPRNPYSVHLGRMFPAMDMDSNGKLLLFLQCK
jgi:hypothetical protein